jgi:hypothetical protein
VDVVGKAVACGIRMAAIRTRPPSAPPMSFAYMRSPSATALRSASADRLGKPDEPGDVYLKWTQDWFGDFQKRIPSTRRSIIKHCEDKVREIRHETRDMPVPNPLRTAVCCDILDKVCATLDADRRRLFSMLKEEILMSIYGPDIAAVKNVDFMKSVPIFSVLASLRAQMAALKEDTANLQTDASAKVDDMAKELQSTVALRAQSDKEKLDLTRKLDLETARYEELRQRANLLERDLKKALENLEQAKLDAEDEIASSRKLKSACDYQLGIAHRLVADRAPREELMQLKAALKEKEARLQQLQIQMRAEKAELTPRPNFFRASEHVEIVTTENVPRRSRDVVDDVCNKLDFTCARLDRLEQRLDRPFVRVDVVHVDWFSLEPAHNKKNVECLFVSYCRPTKARIPPWMNDERRLLMLNACRLSARRFQKFLVEFELSKQLSLDKCREAFRMSGSGKPVADISFVEFANCFVRLAITLNSDVHNTHEDIRGMLRKLNHQLGFDDVEAFYAKLTELERKRAEEPGDLNAANIKEKLTGVPVEGVEEDVDQELSPEDMMLRELRSKHLEIMEQATLGYYRSAEYAAWLAAHPSPRLGVSMGKLYLRKNLTGGKWSDKERPNIFDPPSEVQQRPHDMYDVRFGASPTHKAWRDRVYGTAT